MGQYHLTVNLDREEYINPHHLGDGLKLLEQNSSFASPPGGITTALHVLLTCSNGRGGGDFPDGIGYLKENDYRPSVVKTELQSLANLVVGRWAGDRVAVVGDYTENSDIPNAPIPASLIYSLCGGETDLDEVKDWFQKRHTEAQDKHDELVRSEGVPEGWTSHQLGQAIDNWRERIASYATVLDALAAGVKPFTDITETVRAYLDIAGFADYEGTEGWIQRKPASNPN